MKIPQKEKEVLAQLYANNADVIKYLPFFFNNAGQLKAFIDVFAGKTLKIPASYKDYVDGYMRPDKFDSNKRFRGINKSSKIKQKILESYLNLYPSLYELLKSECNRKD